MYYPCSNCYGIFKVNGETPEIAEGILNEYYEIMEFIKTAGNWHYFKCFTDESVGDNPFNDIAKEGIYYEGDA